jgi:hypothetical protein
MSNNPLLKFVDSLYDFLELLVNEVLHVLSVALDLDDDIPIMLLYLLERDGPIGRDEFILLSMQRLKEHVSFVADSEASKKILKGPIHVTVLQGSRLKGERVALSD